ncbi:YndJ family transporter [Nitriliruptor alkaliphilus]|uniref:YndJ family transporter n=1 Tax=Nitriliruptor alkaliphilus TaxID=427918 RepID=UPI00069794CE|nr:YndJ family transporter [Nitriliruptor alkaliphilus]
MASEVTLTALHDGRRTPRLERTVDEPDLATFAWHRATGAAVAVLVSAAGGLLLAPPAAPGDLAGPILTGTIAAAVVYGVGPLLALVERRRLRDEQVTPARLRRFWLLATLAIACLPAATIDGIVITIVAGPIALVAAWIGVIAGLRLPRTIGRPLAVSVPASFVAAYAVGYGVTLVGVVLGVGVCVVAPAAVRLVPGSPRSGGPVAFACGVPAAVALVLDPHPAIGVPLVVPWVAASVVIVLVVAGRWWRGGRAGHGAVLVVACGYLAFGALWLLADRAAFEPAGFGPPFVRLTAVHFTYAGFVTTVLAACAWARQPDDRVASVAVITIVVAPPIIAVGFLTVGALQIVGAVLLTVGTYALAWVTLRHVVPTVPRSAAWLLGLSSVSVLVPMLLAVQWAVGTNLGTPALSIPHMAATHGVANAVGFALLGVLGWRLVPRERPAAGDGGDG